MSRGLKSKPFRQPSTVKQVHIKRMVGPALVLVWLSVLTPGRGADVVIDSSQTFQTIEGWGHGGGILGGTWGPYYLLGPAIAAPVNYQYLDYLLDDLGLTG